MILDLCPYWTNPTTGGGPERVKHLCESLSRATEVTEISFRPTLTLMKEGTVSLKSYRKKVNARYSEIQVPHIPTILTSFMSAVVGLPQDLCLSDSCSILTPSKIRETSARASAISVEHPWQFRFAVGLGDGKKPLILSTHNCETSLVHQEMKARPSAMASYVLDRVKSLEAYALDHANHVVAVSWEDVSEFKRLLGVDVTKKVTIAPNGVDCRSTTPPTPQQRDEARMAIGAGDETVAVFLGSRHRPNVEAVQRIQEMMPDLQSANVKVFVMGSAGEGLRSQDNLFFLGHVSDYRAYLMAADIALNPLTFGSGTSLKTLEYLAAGIPVVTTAIGIRGIDAEPGVHVAVADIDAFSRYVISLSEDHESRRSLASEGRRLAERKYDWNVIGHRLVENLSNLGYVEECEECAT